MQIMRLLLLFTFSLALSKVFGQDVVPQDTVLVDASEDTTAIDLAKPDSAKRGFSMRPVLLIDYGKLLSTAAGYDEKYEGSLQLLINNKVELVAEYGTSELAPENAYTNGNYQATGSYYRFGAGVYSQLNLKSKIGIGLRYGAASFSDQGLVEIESATGLQDPYTREFARDNLKANWWSAVLTSESKLVPLKSKPEAKINELFAVGFQFRMRFLISYDRDAPVDVYSIPGYGSTLDDQRGAINFFIKIYPF